MAAFRSLRGSTIANAMAVLGCVLTALVAGLTPLRADEGPNRLRTEFVSPPASARPWTWFHVMSGNMSREGMTKDLQAIADAGIGGIVLFHVTQGVSYGPVKFNSPEHRDLIAHVASECERLGIQFSFHNADGWSASGGPWIDPENSMKQVVWSERVVAGGDLTLTMPQPAEREGFYRDIATLAYPSLPDEIADATAPVTIRSSDPTLDLQAISDGNLITSSSLDPGTAATGWVQFSYARPVSVKHVRIVNIKERDAEFSLESSDDGVVFFPVATLVKNRLQRAEWEIEAALTPVTAQHFRVVSSRRAELGEITLLQQARIPQLASQSGLAHVPGADMPPLRAPAQSAMIDPDQIIDLSARVGADGTIRTRLAPGYWTVLRFGYTSTGSRNVVASPEGMGLEVDKFDAVAFGRHYDAFIAPTIARTRSVAPTALTGVMIDSYEVGGQNWTAGYEKRFAQAQEIDLIPWLPIFAGRFVASGEQTAAMFARLRRFNAELMTKNYFGEFARRLADGGLESLIEPYGNGPFDELAAGAAASVPVGEFWVGRDDLTHMNGAVSAARMYGAPVVSAEAFTAIWDTNWNFSPAFAKRWGDRAWVAGINGFMFHRFTHQANTHVMPGMTMNRWGSHFDRTQPWWRDGGRAWFGYMARGQHMLRQGHAVADIAMAVGSNSPVVCPEKSGSASMLPVGVEFDCLDTETLLERSQFDQGTLVLPNGARYRMIWWPHQSEPAPDVLARMEVARSAGIPVAMAHRGDSPAQIFEAAGLRPRLYPASELQTMPSFTQRRVKDTDILFVFNDSDTSRDFDLCAQVDGKAGQMWDPNTGQIQGLAGAIEPMGCSRIAFHLAPYESKFLVFDPSFIFTRAHQPATRIIANLDDGWNLEFDPGKGSAPPLVDAALLDWSTSQDPEIRHYSGTVFYRKIIRVPANARPATGRLILDLGRVETVAKVRINGHDAGTVWTAPYRLDVTELMHGGDNTVEIAVSNLWVNRLIGDAALPDTSGYQPENNLGYRIGDNLPKRQMVEWYVANRPAPPGPRRTWATQNFQNADDPLVPSGLLGPVTLYTTEP